MRPVPRRRSHCVSEGVSWGGGQPRSPGSGGPPSSCGRASRRAARAVQTSGGLGGARLSRGCRGSQPPEPVLPGWACARPTAEVTAARKNHGCAHYTLPPPDLCLRLPQRRPGPLEEQDGRAGPVGGPGWPRLGPPAGPKALLPEGSAGGLGETGPASSLLGDPWLLRRPPAVTRFRGPTWTDTHTYARRMNMRCK